MTAHTRRGNRAAIAAGAVMLFATAVLAQTPPPIPGATGVVTPEGGGNGATAAVGAAAGKAVEGTRHLLRAVGIGGKDDETSSADPLKSLELGMAVAVRDEANPAAPANEGKVIELDRHIGVIVVRFADKTTERLQLAEGKRSTVAAGGRSATETAGTIRVSYVGANGDKVVALFRKLS